MQYLKMSVSGTAKVLIQNLPSNEAGYKHAWKMMKTRFDNKRAIVNACLRLLLSQEQILVPNAKKHQRANRHIETSHGMYTDTRNRYVGMGCIPGVYNSIEDG